MKSLGIQLFVLCLILMLKNVNVYPSKYYVHSDGNDSYSREQAKFPDTPWQTIQYSTNQLGPGDTLLIRGGVYTEIVNIKVNGTAGNRILICNYPEEEVVIDGLWDSIHHPDFPVLYENGTIDKLWDNLWLVSGDNVTVKGLTFKNSPGRAISSSGCKGLVITDFNIVTCYGGALVVNLSDSCLIQNGYIEDCSAQFRVQGSPPNSHVVAPVQSTNTIFRNLIISGCWGEAISGNRGYNTLIDNVTVINNAKVCFYMNLSAKCAVRNSVAYWTDEYVQKDKTARAIIIADEYAGEAKPHLGLTSDIVFVNNLILNCDRALHIASGNSRASNMPRVLIANNTFRTIKGGEALLFNNLKSSEDNPRVWENVFIENNIFDGAVISSVSAANQDKIHFSNNAWAVNSPEWMRSEDDYFGPIQYSGPESTSIQEISSFDIIDHSLAPNSALLNKGKDVSDVAGVTSVPFDILGVLRDSLPDIGAFECTSEPAPSSELDYLNSTITIDGNDDDWSSVNANEILVDKSASNPGADDLSASFKGVLNENNLYLSFRINDQTLANSDIPDVPKGDYIEIGLTFGNGEYDLSEESSDDAKLQFCWNDSLVMTGTNLKEGGIGVDYAYLEFSGGYALEIMIPFSDVSQNHIPSNDYILWAEFAISDSDNGTEKKHELRWSGTTDLDSDMNGFGLLLLSGNPLSGVKVNVLQEEPVCIYPNPASDQLQIGNLKGLETIEIYNLSGQKLRTIQNGRGSSIEININDYYQGPYIVGLISENDKRSFFKFIKR